MRILIFGGTGGIGANLVDKLKSKEHNIYITTRQRIKSTHNQIFVNGNAQELTFVKNLLHEQWDVIIDFMVYNTTTFKDRIDYILNATSQYIYISSGRVYDCCENPMNELAPRLMDKSTDQAFLRSNDYSLEKARQEDILINCKKANWTIVRPYITYSDKRLQLSFFEKEEWLYRLLKGRSLVLSREILASKTTLTSGYDVARGIESIMGKESAYQQIFNVTIGNKCSKTWIEILEIYLSVLEKRLGYYPKVLFAETSQLLSIKPYCNYQLVYDRLFNRMFDSSKIAKYINVDEFYDPSYGLQLFLEKFLEHPRFKKINWKFQAEMDKLSQERAPFNEIEGLKQKLKYNYFRYF